jgi:hypothetical protein
MVMPKYFPLTTRSPIPPFVKEGTEKKVEGQNKRDPKQRGGSSTSVEKTFLFTDDLAVVHAERHWSNPYASSGGIGMYSQIHVFYKNMYGSSEHRWRDSNSHHGDNPAAYVHGIKSVEVKEVEGGKLIAMVEPIWDCGQTVTIGLQLLE